MITYAHPASCLLGRRFVASGPPRAGVKIRATVDMLWSGSAPNPQRFTSCADLEMGPRPYRCADHGLWIIVTNGRQRSDRRDPLSGSVRNFRPNEVSGTY